MPIGFLVFLSNLLFFMELTIFQVNISLYLYPYDYISLKGTHGELKCLIKPFTRLETSSNSEQLSENSVENPDSRFSISRKLLLIDRVLFSID